MSALKDQQRDSIQPTPSTDSWKTSGQFAVFSETFLWLRFSAHNYRLIFNRTCLPRLPLTIHTGVWLVSPLRLDSASTVTNLQKSQVSARNFAGTQYGLINSFGTTTGFITPWVGGEHVLVCARQIVFFVFVSKAFCLLFIKLVEHNADHPFTFTVVNP